MSKERRQQNGVLLIVVWQSYRTRDISESGYWLDSGQRKGSYAPASRKRRDRPKKIPRFRKVHVRTSFILSAQDLKLSCGTFQRRNLLFCLLSLPTFSSLGSSKPPLKGEQKQGRRHSEQWEEDVSHTIASSHVRLKLEKGRQSKSTLPGVLWIRIGFFNFSVGDCFRIW